MAWIAKMAIKKNIKDGLVFGLVGLLAGAAVGVPSRFRAPAPAPLSVSGRARDFLVSFQIQGTPQSGARYGTVLTAL